MINLSYKDKYLIKRNWIFYFFLFLTLSIWIFNINKPLFLKVNSFHYIVPNYLLTGINFIALPKYFILPLMLIALTYVYRRIHLSRIIFLIVIYYVIFTLLKKVSAEARPYMVLDSSIFYWQNIFENAKNVAYKSFPSGHTGNMAVFVFSLNILFFQNSGIFRFLMFILLSFTALARILTGWHWPIDVLASGLISYILVKIVLNNIKVASEY